MIAKFSVPALFSAIFMSLPGLAWSWGPEGHAATGILAMELTDAVATKELASILGSTANSRIDEMCNWPDAMKDLSEWDWASPQHYVNIPRYAEYYDAERDCREGLCVTEAIKKYANQLGDGHLPREKRAEAFGWLCHLVGDLHQPLHCGFRDDRGGNTVDVIFLGREMNLHEYWDRQLILERSATLDGLLANLGALTADNLNSEWIPGVVDDWTWESHQLALARSYPDTTEISPAFADESWVLITRQIPLAALRLAEILNATLGEGEVVLEP